MQTKEKKWLVGLIAALAMGVLLTAPRAGAQTVPVYAGQNHLIGQAYAGVYQGTVYVAMETDPSWNVTLVHLAVADSPDSLPVTKKGSPKVGNFPFHFPAAPGQTTFYWEIPVDPNLQYVAIALHAEVEGNADLGNSNGGETAWAGDIPFGKGWATFFVAGQFGDQ